MITNLNPIEIEEKIKSVTDYLGYPVDKGIFRSVVILNSLGFTTNQSCEGHFNRYNTYPWIDIKFKTKTQKEKESALIMAKLIFQNLNEFYKKRNNCAYDESIFLRKIFESDKEFTIRISQNENSKCFIGKRKQKLKKYLNEINDFCEFLNQKYQLNY